MFAYLLLQRFGLLEVAHDALKLMDLQFAKVLDDFADAVVRVFVH